MGTLEDARMPSLRDKQLAQAAQVEEKVAKVEESKKRK